MEGSHSLEEEYLTCSMCFEIFKNPKALPCLHTFCLECLKKFINSQESVIKKHGTFNCPMCRAKTKPLEPGNLNINLWAESFTNNHLVVSMTERLKAQKINTNAGSTSQSDSNASDSIKSDGSTGTSLCSICKSKLGNRWCEQCFQNLCSTCEKQHSKNPDSIMHVVVDAHVNNAHSSDSPLGAESDQMNNRPCAKHPGEYDSYYCVKCSVACCSMCVSANHLTCFQVLPLQQAVQNKVQLGQVYTSIIELQKDNLKHLKCLVSTKLQENCANHERLCHEIMSIRPMVEKILAKDEIKLLGELKAKTTKITTELNQMQTTCQKNIDVLHAKGEVFKSALDMNTVERLHFLSIWDDISEFMKKNSSQHLDIKTQLGNLHTSYVTFEKSNSIDSILKASGSTIGSLVPRRLSSRTNTAVSGETPSSHENPAPVSNRLTLKSSRNLKLDSERTPLLTGICLLPDDVVVMTDFSNNKLKMFDQQRKLKYCILPSSPYGVTYKSDTDQIVITLPNSKELAYVSSILKIEKQVKVLKEYSAVLFDKYQRTLVCTSASPGCIDILYDDVVIKTLDLASTRRPLFAQPEYLALYSKQNILVSDWEKKALFCIDHKGNVISTFTGDLGVNELQCPLGIAIDPNGLIYLADKEKSRIFRFSTDLKFESIILTQSDRIKQPIAMVFDSRGHLFVTENSGYLKLFA